MVRGYSQMAAAPLIEFVSAAEYGDMDAVAQLYTDSFAEYYSAGQLVPVAVSAEDLASYLREEQMGLAMSSSVAVSPARHCSYVGLTHCSDAARALFSNTAVST